MRRRDIFPLALLPCAGFGSQEQDAEVRFAAGAREVRLDVLVANGKGPVEGLRAEDFLVLDEGRPVKLTYGGVGEQPLSVLLLLDVSGSMKQYLEQIGRRARQLVELLEANDKAAVMVFTKDTDYFRPFTGDKDRLVYALDQAMRPVDMPAGTSINAALVDAAQAFADLPAQPAYNTIVILTDNRGLNYQIPDSLVLEKLYGADTVLHSVVTKKAERPRPTASANPDFSFANVFALSEATGGEVLRTDRADEAFAQLLRNARRRYLLSFVAPPANAGAEKQFRRLEVKLSPAAAKRVGKVTIRARQGYYL
ncbi:MAG: VWA domain-containing protein [Bryobacter sp.]|nr:VWA domain-containing protein [Bryobacter sp.]